VAGTAIHEDFHQTMATYSQGHSNQADNTAPHQTAVDGTKTTPKSERKPCRGTSSLNRSCCYTKPPVQTFITYLLFFTQARRTGFAALKWQAISYERLWKYFTVILIIYFLFALFWRLIWSRVGMLWRMGGWEYLKHFVQRKRTLVLESCLWARCLDLCTFLLPYMFSAFVKNTRCVLCCRQIRGV
jgi:hypothetical protein